MDILQNILQLFGDKAGQFAPLLEFAAKNNFDLKSMLQNLDVSALAPLFGQILSPPAQAERETPAPAVPLDPIANVADRDIVYCLNRYLSAAAE